MLMLVMIIAGSIVSGQIIVMISSSTHHCIVLFVFMFNFFIFQQVYSVIASERLF